MTSTTPVLSDLDVLAAQEPFVRALAKSLLFDDAQVDDVVQETWIEALRRGIPAGAGARHWLSRVVRSRALNALRGRRRRQHHEGAAALAEALPSAADLLSRNEQRQRVIAAVAALGEPYRSAILLRYFEGLEPRAIAAKLELSVDTVNTRLKRARTMLRERLDADNDGDRRGWMLALVPIAASREVARGAVMAKVFGLLALLSAMKPLLIVIGASLLAIFLARNLTAPDRDRPDSAGRVSAATPTERVGDTTSAVDDRVTEPNATKSRIPAVGGVAATRDELGPDQLTGLTGILVDPAGRPLPGRKCRLLSLDPVNCHPGAFEPKGEAMGAAFSALDVTTDERGRFRFEAVPAGQTHALWLGHGGAHATLRPLGHELPAGVVVDLGIVTLELRGAVIGRIVGADGRPIADATVRAVDIPGALLGLAPIDRLERGGALFCAYPDPSSIQEESEAVTALAARMRRFLARDVPTADPDGRFCVLPFPSWFEGALAALPIPEARTDADGRFRIEGLVDGDHALLIEATGFARRIESRVAIQNGELRDRGDIRLETGDTFTVRVLDAQKQPCVDAEVRVAVRPRLGLSGILFGSAPSRTDAAGTVVFANLPRSELVVAVRTKSSTAWHVETDLASDEDTDIVLPALATAQLRLVRDELPFGGAVEFIVRAGPPMGEVSAAGLVPVVDVRAEAVVGQPGDHRLVGLLPGLYTVDVLAADCALTQAMVVVDPSRAQEPITVRLSAGMAFDVTVVDTADRALPGCEVWVFPSADQEAAYSQSILFSYGGFRAWDRLGRGGRRTDADGRVRIEHLAQGSATVLVRHRGLGNHVESVDLASGGARIVLRESGSVRGVVTDSRRPPQPGSVVLTRSPVAPTGDVGFPLAPVAVRLDADGHFSVGGLSPGTWEFHAVRAQSQPDASLGDMLRRAQPMAWYFGDRSGGTATVSVTSGGMHEIALDVDPFAAGTSEGTARVLGVVSLDGRPLAGQSLRASPTFGGHGQTSEFAVTDAQGRFSRDGVRAESFLLHVQLPDRPRIEWMRELEPVAGRELRVDVSLAMRDVEIVVVNAAGLPATDSTVWLNAFPEEGTQIRCGTFLDANGSARLRLPIARYEVGADGAFGSIRQDGFDPSMTPRLVLRLDETRLVRGSVSLPAGQKLRAIRFRDPEESSDLQLFVYDTNDFTTTALAPGGYEVALITEEGEFDAEPKLIRVPEVGPTDLRLRLGPPRRP